MSGPSKRRHVFYSPAELFGLTLEEFDGTYACFEQCVHPEDLPALNESLLQCQREQTQYYHEFRLVWRDGSVHWVAGSGRFSYHDKTGKAVKMQGVVIDITERKQTEALLLIQNQILEKVAHSAPLTETLTALIRLMESQSPDLLGSIQLLDADGVHLQHGAAPRLPSEYCQAIDGITIGPSVGSCGTAAFRGEPVIVEDIGTDPLWADYQDVALAHELRACWSTPIFDASRSVLGTFAMYFRRPTRPTAKHLQLNEIATQTAAIPISRARDEGGLRKSEEKFHALFESSRDSVMLLDRTGFFDCNQATLDLFGCASRDQFVTKHPSELSPPTQADGTD